MNESAIAAERAAVSKLFGEYSPLPGSYDELFAGAGAPHAHCSAFIDRIEAIGRQDLNRRWELAQRLVHQNGISLSTHVGPRDRPRRWQLDAFPLVVSSSDWKAVSAALRQRAMLLNQIVADLYGPQHLLKNGLIPPEMVFRNPGFLRPVHGHTLPRQRFLHFYAADLVRSKDGQWCVLADRTDNPSGIGYALENRIVISRMLPEVFQQCQVQRLAPYFIAMQESLSRLASQHRENPRIAVLSRGPAHRNYFEDTYLARYLGYTLVEGGDLDVRNQRVMLKTLGGLLPVDVVVRRNASVDCDPLELDMHSTGGIAGLLNACRSGSVVLANPIGSGVLESPALSAFLPDICQALLGQSLKMPGIATWWCGNEADLNYVLKNLDELQIRHSFNTASTASSGDEQLRQMSSQELAKRIQADPAAFVGQQKVARSTMPVWSEQNLEHSWVALRAYLVADGAEYTAMNGALARVSSSMNSGDDSEHMGEMSKDVWVLADGPVQPISLLDRPGQVIELRRSGNELPSRVADNIYWLGRLLERSEAAARLLRTTVLRLTSESDTASLVELPVLIRAVADQGQIEPGFAIEGIRDQLPTMDRALPITVFDESQPGSLRSILNELFRIGSVLRDRLSIDGWRIIQRIDEEFRPPVDGTTHLSDLLVMIGDVVIDLAAFSGIVMESMTRTQAFRFLNLGRRLERAFQTVRLVKSCLVPLPKVQGPVFEAVLEVADSLMTYRSRYLGNLQLAAVLDLLLTDETNPRSVSYQFLQLTEHVDQLPRDHAQPSHCAEQRIAMSLVHSVRMMDIQVVAEEHHQGEHEPLDRILQSWIAQLPQLSDAITHKYLVHALPSTQLSDMRPD